LVWAMTGLLGMCRPLRSPRSSQTTRTTSATSSVRQTLAPHLHRDSATSAPRLAAGKHHPHPTDPSMFSQQVMDVFVRSCGALSRNQRHPAATARTVLARRAALRARRCEHCMLHTARLRAAPLQRQSHGTRSARGVAGSIDALVGAPRVVLGASQHCTLSESRWARKSCRPSFWWADTLLVCSLCSWVLRV
jgi:hypothetical protein